MNIVICEDDVNYCNYIHDLLTEHIRNTRSNSKIVLTTEKALIGWYCITNTG